MNPLILLIGAVALVGGIFLFLVGVAQTKMVASGEINAEEVANLRLGSNSYNFIGFVGIFSAIPGAIILAVGLSGILHGA